jgi:CRP-like cAMP-binding protein
MVVEAGRDGFRNAILDQLDPASVPLIGRGGLQRVQLEAGQILNTADTLVTHLYFPVSCITSLCIPFRSGAAVEVASVGNEGVVGVNVLLDATQSYLTTIVTVPGVAFRSPAEEWRNAINRFPPASAPFGAFARRLVHQIAQLAACNRAHPLDARLARWLLTAEARLGPGEFRITHESLATILGVRRASVSQAIEAFQARGVLALGRGRIAILDRSPLEETACECYDVISRLLDPASRYP